MPLPQYENFPSITGDRISLRQVLDRDMPDLIEISFYDAVKAETVEQAAEMQAKINIDYNNGDSIHWAIVDNVTDKIVGTCGYYRGFNTGEGELGCVLLSQYKGKGYMTNAMELAINFGLHSIGLKRIWAVTSQQNDKAQQLLERLNFKKIAELEDEQVEYELIQSIS